MCLGRSAARLISTHAPSGCQTSCFIWAGPESRCHCLKSLHFRAFGKCPGRWFATADSAAWQILGMAKLGLNGAPGHPEGLFPKPGVFNSSCAAF